jgi:hypothetical protein
MSTLYILGNGFDLDLGYDTTYSKYIESPQFTGDAFMEVKGLMDSSNEEVVKIANYIKNNAKGDLWFDLEKCLTDYYDVFLNLEFSGTERSIDFLDKHRLEVLPIIRKSITEFIHRKVDYGNNNNIIKVNSRAYKLIKDMFIKVFSDPNSKIITFNYTGTSILKKQLIDFIDEDNKNIINKEKINITITSIHGDYDNEKNNNGGIVLGSSENFIKTEHAKKLLDKPAQEHIINGNRNDEFFSKFHTVLIFGHSFGETDSYYFSNLLQHMKGNSKKFFIYTADNGRDAIIDNIRKNIDYGVLTSSVHLDFNNDKYFENIQNEFVEFRASYFNHKK